MMNRRDAITSMSLAGGASLIPSGEAIAGASRPEVSSAFEQAVRGTAPVKIRDIKTILTAPNRIRLVVVKVETTEPGLVGWGCATFTQRALVVQTAVDEYLKPFLIGRNVDEIEDIWQSSYVSSYWRNGPVLFNAMSGVDIALWDIKGKRAGHAALPAARRQGAARRRLLLPRQRRELHGGRRERAQRGMEQGFRHVRVQVSTPGLCDLRRAQHGAGAGGAGRRGRRPDQPARDLGVGAVRAHAAEALRAPAHASSATRSSCCTTSTSACTLNEAINLCKALEPYRLFFLEDPFPPEDNDYFRLLRQQTSIPIAMGELFNTQHEYLPLIKERLIDFIRIHISQIGGLSPARKVAALCEFFGVRTAWHGPGDASPLAHAAQLALELASYNFGIHEGGSFPKETQEVFVGCPESQERLHAGAREAGPRHRRGREASRRSSRFPAGPPNFDYSWGTTRRRDGTVITTVTQC